MSRSSDREPLAATQPGAATAGDTGNDAVGGTVDATAGVTAHVTVDVTLIDSMLALSPVERLRQNDRMIRTIEELRHGFAAARAHDAARQAGGERD